MARPTSTACEDAVRFARYRRTGDPAEREALVLRYLPLARHLAARYLHGGERDDVMQVAALGLLRAIDRFDPERGLAFSTFAVPTILGEVKRYFRDQGWMVRVPREIQELSLRLDRAVEELTGVLGRTPTVEDLAAHCRVTAEQVVEARATTTAHHALSLDRPTANAEDTDAFDQLGGEDPGFARVEDATQLRQLLDQIPPRERRILLLRFGHELKQREIAQLVGISQMHVSRVIARSLATLERAA